MKDKKTKRTILYGITAVFGILVLLFLLTLLFSNRNNRGLKLWRANNAALIIADGGEAFDVEFPTLNSNPANYQNQFIRVSGDYQRAPLISCANPAGPTPRWSLLNGDLSLEAIGFNNVLRLVPASTPMVVEGVWRRYSGPLGCGKGQRAVVWYLETVRIVSPNPLTNFDGTAVYPSNPDGSTPIITSTPTIARETASPEAPIAPTATTESASTTEPAATASTPTAITTLPPVELTETAVSATLTGTPTRITANTPTPTWIPTATVQNGPTRTPIPTNTTAAPLPTSTPAPPGPTSTPGNYPAPSPTVVPTPY